MWSHMPKVQVWCGFQRMWFDRGRCAHHPWDYEEHGIWFIRHSQELVGDKRDVPCAESRIVLAGWHLNGLLTSKNVAVGLLHWMSICCEWLEEGLMDSPGGGFFWWTAVSASFVWWAMLWRWNRQMVNKTEDCNLPCDFIFGGVETVSHSSLYYDEAVYARYR